MPFSIRLLDDHVIHQIEANEPRIIKHMAVTKNVDLESKYIDKIENQIENFHR